MFTPFLVALQFLTLTPPLLRRNFTAMEMGRAVGFFPLVGLTLGLLLAGSGILLGLVFPPGVQAALLLALWVWLTGALHLDGFLDTLDGLLGGFTPERRLEIMRDERVGAYGLAGGVLLLLTMFAALQALLDAGAAARALILAPVLGRWALGLGIVLFPYARAHGLGRDMKDQAGWRELLLGTLIALLASWLAAGWAGLLAAGLTVLLVWVTGRFALRRIPGLTGDVYGALCILAELAVLLVFTAQ